MIKCITVLSLVLLFLVALSPLPASAQTPAQQRFVAGGLGFVSTNADPGFVGWGAAAIPLNSDGSTLTVTEMDFSVARDNPQVTLGPIGFRYVLHQGLLQRVYRCSNTWGLWALVAPGFKVESDNVAAVFKYGGVIHKDIGKGWGGIVQVGAETSSVTKLSIRAGVTRKF
jgi:hypothetical protein